MLLRPPVFLVADGMGGHAAGEVASGVAVSVFAELAGRTVTRHDVIDAIGRVNEEIVTRGRRDPATAGMGTTLTGLVAVQEGGVDHVLVFNVGDSRVYRWKDGALVQITVDHSEVQDLVDQGVLDQDQARADPRRNIVTRSLGTEPTPQADVWMLAPEVGERYLVCSDGLTGELTDEAVSTMLSDVPDPGEAAERLVREAVAAGGRDNITVVVIDVLDVGTDELDEETAPRAEIEEARHGDDGPESEAMPLIMEVPHGVG